MSDRSVLIAGCGIAGPALGYWLLQHGFQVTLVEKAPGLRLEGYAIDFWGLGYDLVERMGVLPQILDAGYSMREVRLVNERSRRVGGFDVAVFRSATSGRFTTLPRADLSAILYGAIKDRAVVRWDTAPIALEQLADGVKVHFSDGSSDHFYCVVGADGVHSTIRQQIFGDSTQEERYLGLRVVAFETTGYRQRDELTYVSHADPGRQIARVSLRHDRTLFLLTAREPQPGPPRWERPAALEYLHHRFADMGWEAADILSAAEATRNIYIDRVSQVRSAAWWRGHVALVGDAAYAPSLLAGQGSALAIVGAYVLAGELARSVTPAGAFDRYQARLQAFIRDKQDAAEKFAGSFIPKTMWGVWARNLATRAMAWPSIAKLAMGNTLTDELELPEYE